MKHKALHNLIDKFLAKRKKSDYRLASVDESEIDCLYTIMDQLIQKKYEPDPDGDYPIDIKLVDRTRYEPSHYFLIPYDTRLDEKLNEDQTLALNINRLRNAVSNLAIAQETLDYCSRVHFSYLEGLMNKSKFNKEKKCDK